MKIVVDKENYKGFVKTIIGESGKCPYHGKTEAEYIAEGYTVMSEEEYYLLQEAWENSLCGDWKEISEEFYDDALNVLPPVAWYDGGFFMSERFSGDVTSFYQKMNGKYYSSLQRMGTAREEIIKSLKEYISKTENK